jgi:serine/threonine-protein kinase
MESLLGGRYRRERSIGYGPMGEVFLGQDTDGNPVAIKVLRRELATDPNVLRRFAQDRDILAALRHPNLVGIRELVADGENLAIVTDLIPGANLRQALTTDRTLLPVEVARIGAAIAAGLAALHENGMVHRDLKPENVLLDSSVASALPRLADGGLFRLVSGSEQGRRMLLFGTSEYVAPELTGDDTEPTPASDLYSLGVVLYELCCGVTPFAGGSLFAVLNRHRERYAGRPPGIPDPLWYVIARLLIKDPTQRPQSARQIAGTLDALTPDLLYAPVAARLDAPPPGAPVQPPTQGVPMAPPPASRPRRRRVAITVLAVAALLVGGFVGVRTVSSSGNSGSPSNPGAPAQSVNQGPETSAPARTTEPAQPTSAAPTVAPDLVGKPLSAAETLLGSTIKLTTTDTVDENATDGTVLTQDPKPGAPLNGAMQLTVARQAALIYLESLRPASGQWSENNPADLSGKNYPHSVLTAVDDCGDRQAHAIEYNIGKSYRRLSATVGIEDSAPDSSLQVLLEIFADGRKVFSNTIVYGKTIPLDVDVAGVLRLKMQWQVVAGRGSCAQNYLALGEGKLLGLPSEVPQPTTTTG